MAYVTIHDLFVEMASFFGLPVSATCPQEQLKKPFLHRLNECCQLIWLAPKNRFLASETITITISSLSEGEQLDFDIQSVIGPVRLTDEPSQVVIPLSSQSEFDTYTQIFLGADSAPASETVPRFYYAQSNRNTGNTSAIDNAQLIRLWMLVRPAPSVDTDIDMDVIRHPTRYSLGDLVEGGVGALVRKIIFTIDKTPGQLHHTGFTFTTPNLTVGVWFNTDNAADPYPGPFTSDVDMTIDILLVTGDTAAQIATKTVAQLNIVGVANGEWTAVVSTSTTVNITNTFPGSSDLPVNGGSGATTTGLTITTSSTLPGVRGANVVARLPHGYAESLLMPLLRWKMMTDVTRLSSKALGSKDTVKLEYDAAMAKMGYSNPNFEAESKQEGAKSE